MIGRKCGDDDSKKSCLTNLFDSLININLLICQREMYVVRVVATDKGSPPLSSAVLVDLKVVDRANRPPIWDQRVYGPINILENTSVGHTIFSVKARFVICSARSWELLNRELNRNFSLG